MELLLALIVGVLTAAGVWLVRRFSSQRFYDIVYVLLFLLGCKLMADGVLKILS